MLKRKLLAFGAILSVVGMLIGFTGCTQAELLALQGTLKNVDSVTGIVTMTMKDGTTQTFNFKDVKIDTIKNALGSATLEVGDNVTVKIRQNHVEEVSTRYAEVEGVIKGLGTDNLTITTENHGDIVLKVNPQTRIRVGDNVSAAFADLKAGQSVEARYDVSSGTAVPTAVLITVDVEEGKALLGHVEGIVRAVGPGNITVQNGHGDNVTINVTADTRIKIQDERTGSLQDITAGRRVNVFYDKATQNAVRIVLQSPQGDKGPGGQGPGGQGEERRSIPQTSQTAKPKGDDNRQGRHD
jgi:hypothetical protein